MGLHGSQAHVVFISLTASFVEQVPRTHEYSYEMILMTLLLRARRAGALHTCRSYEYNYE